MQVGTFGPWETAPAFDKASRALSFSGSSRLRMVLSAIPQAPFSMQLTVHAEIRSLVRTSLTLCLCDLKARVRRVRRRISLPRKRVRNSSALTRENLNKFTILAYNDMTIFSGISESEQRFLSRQQGFFRDFCAAMLLSLYLYSFDCF